MNTESQNIFQQPILPDRGSGYEAGQILFANSSRFQETYFSEPLANYAVGWRDPSDIQASLQFVAPAVPVGRRFEWKSAITPRNSFRKPSTTSAPSVRISKRSIIPARITPTKL